MRFDELGGIFRQRTGSSGYDSERLSDIAHRIPRQHGLEKWGNIAMRRNTAGNLRKLRRQILSRHHGDDACTAHGSSYIDTFDSRVGMRTSHDHRFRSGMQLQIRDVTTLAAKEPLILEARLP
jgi:hypothetical protein